MALRVVEQSRLGIAFGRQASATALETADVVMVLPVLGRLAERVRLGRHCRRLLAQNITLALSIKPAALVAAGEATLWMAVAANVDASVLVIFNGMRILDDRSQIWVAGQSCVAGRDGLGTP